MDQRGLRRIGRGPRGTLAEYRPVEYWSNIGQILVKLFRRRGLGLGKKNGPTIPPGDRTAARPVPDPHLTTLTSSRHGAPRRGIGTRPVYTEYATLHRMRDRNRPRGTRTDTEAEAAAERGLARPLRGGHSESSALSRPFRVSHSESAMPSRPTPLYPILGVCVCGGGSGFFSEGCVCVWEGGGVKGLLPAPAVPPCHTVCTCGPKRLGSLPARRLRRRGLGWTVTGRANRPGNGPKRTRKRPGNDSDTARE